MAAHVQANMKPTSRPTITSLQDITIAEGFDPDTHELKWTCWYHVTPEEEVWLGESTKGKRRISIKEYDEGLQHIPDEEIYPKVPDDFEIRIAPAELNEDSAYVKRPGLTSYIDMKDTSYIPNNLMDETRMMEMVSKLEHPHIVHYHGVRVRRGRITSIFIEKLDKTLSQYAETPEFDQLDKDKFLEALCSAVDAVHGLGLAHNDLNPHNIMVKNGMPVLIDFGSCAPFGKRISSLGTNGWVEEQTVFSDKEKDEFAMRKLPVWWEKPGVSRYPGEVGDEVTQ